MLKLKPSPPGLSYSGNLGFFSSPFHLQLPLYLSENLCSTLTNKHCQIKRFLVNNSSNLREELMVSHRQDVPSFSINSIQLVNLQNLFLFYDQLLKVHWTWCSSFPNFSILTHVTQATYLSNWKFLGMEAWISQFHHSSIVNIGCKMGTWCSLIKYCICNRVKCSLTYPCSKLSTKKRGSLGMWVMRCC